MKIFKSDDSINFRMQTAWNEMEPECFTMNAWELADNSTFSADEWTEFLSDGQVQKYISKQTSAIKEANQRKLIYNAGDNEKSVGAAQMLNAITKVETTGDTESCFFIYSYVPPTDDQAAARDIPMPTKEQIHEQLEAVAEAFSEAQEEEDWF